MILRAVQNAKDDDVLTNDAKKYFVGKAMSEDAPQATVVNGETFGIGLQSQQGFGVVGEKFITQSRAPFFIPIMGAAEVGLGPDGDIPFHRRDSRI
jgi:hypothetical protein